MSNKIEEIEGIEKNYAEKLRAVDIQTTDDLLRRCGDKKGREGVSRETSISETHILDWVNIADLMRINGIGEEYANLLKETGVDTVKELAFRNADNLTVMVEITNSAKKISKRTPSDGVIQEWIDEAKTLDAMVTY
jgi:predicted flap endonuclease-1-like 5' DNA nuclease